MITLTYILLAIAPMLLGALALLCGWLHGWAISGPMPCSDAARALPCAPQRSRVARLYSVWLAASVIRVGMGVARQATREPCHIERGLYGVPASGVPPPD